MADNYLEKKMEALSWVEDSTAASLFCRDQILPAMAELRRIGDSLESLTGAEYWPFPTYGELLFGVR